MKKSNFYFILLFLGLVPVLCWGQNQEIDSLKMELARSGQDTQQVNILNDLAYKIFRSEPDSAIAYSRQAVTLSEKLNFQKGVAYAFKNIGLAYYVKGNYEEVFNYWERSLSAFQAMDDKLGISNLLNNLGAVHFNLGNDPEALELYLESLRVSEVLGNKLRIATALTNIGAVYFNYSVNHVKAQSYYLRALEISEEIGDPAAIGTSIVNLGEIYIEKGKLDSALLLFEKALDAYEKTGANPAYVLNDIGKVYTIRNELGKAMQFHKTAYERSLELEGKLDITQSQIGMADVFLAQGIRDKDPTDLAKALDFYTQAYQEAQANDWKFELQKAAEGLYKVYKERGNFTEALKYHEVYAVVKDTLYGDENINLLAVLSSENEFEKQKQQLQFQAEAQLKRQRSIQYAAVAGVVVLLIIIGILLQYYRLRRQSAAQQFESQRQLIIQDKLASLGQITAGIAHEIKNPLNFVTNFAEGSIELGQELQEIIADNKEKLPEDQFELVQEILDDLNENAKTIQESGLRADRVVKRMMEQARGDKGEPQKVDINTLIDENVNLAYHGYRGNVADFNVNIIEEFDPDAPEIEVIPQDIGRVILNLFNNACYALYEKQKQSEAPFQPEIKVQTLVEDKHLVIRMRDNGPGIPDHIRKKVFAPFFTTKPIGSGNTGLGLSISRDLIVLGHNGEIAVDSKAGEYTIFTIRLPLEQSAALVSVE